MKVDAPQHQEITGKPGHITFNHGVVGSSPTALTREINRLRGWLPTLPSVMCLHCVCSSAATQEAAWLRDVALYIFERRRFVGVAFAIAAVGLSLLAIVSSDHPPDPSSCKLQDNLPFVMTQTMTPTIAATCLNAGPRPSLR
jgi:hypothetical protein